VSPGGTTSSRRNAINGVRRNQAMNQVLRADAGYQIGRAGRE
jgi:hypothetical protein